MQQEVWRKAVKYPDYEVSTHGRVRRPNGGGKDHKTPNYVLTPTFSSRGYHKVCLMLNRKSACGLIHRMVAATFIGPRPLGREVNHKDGDKLNNHINNLEYVTHLQNQQHASRNGLYVHGEAHSDARLTEADVKAIRAFYIPYTKGHGACIIARMFGVSTATISALLSGRTWRHV